MIRAGLLMQGRPEQKGQRSVSAAFDEPDDPTSLCSFGVRRPRKQRDVCRLLTSGELDGSNAVTGPDRSILGLDFRCSVLTES
jgi:hypothetical protein